MNEEQEIRDKEIIIEKESCLCKSVLLDSAKWLVDNKCAEYKPSNTDDKYLFLWQDHIYKKCSKGYELFK